MKTVNRCSQSKELALNVNFRSHLIQQHWKTKDKNEICSFFIWKFQIYTPVAVTMKGSGLTHGAVPFITAISTVQLVVASLCDRVAHRPPSKATGRHRSLPRHPAGKLVQTAAPAALLVLPCLRTVPFPVAALLLSKATSCRSPTPALPRGAIGPDVESGVEPAPLRARKGFIGHRKQASTGFNLNWFVIRGAGNLSTCKNIVLTKPLSQNFKMRCHS